MSSPAFYTAGIAASVDMGDGGAHDPQIRFTADDESCRWNGFPICIDVEYLPGYSPLPIATTTQLSSFTTTAGGGASGPSNAQWPHSWIYDYVEAILAGYKLTYRYRFTATSAGTSVGSVAVQAVGDGNCSGSTQPGPILGAYDSGVLGGTGICQNCSSGATDPYELAMVFTNFNPITGSVTITNGILDLAWVPVSSPVLYKPNQSFHIEWRPPGCIGDVYTPDPGLYITLGTDSCGNLLKTYTQVANEVNALGLGITASILGGHGSDLAKPDPSCLAPDYCCDMTGATCTGGVDSSEGN